MKMTRVLLSPILSKRQRLVSIKVMVWYGLYFSLTRVATVSRIMRLCILSWMD